MAISNSGPVSCNDVMTELGNATDTQVSIQNLCSGDVGDINQASTIKPNGSAPYSLSDFRGYDHAATVDMSSLQTSLISWHEFNETSGGTIADSHGTHTGTNTGAELSQSANSGTGTSYHFNEGRNNYAMYDTYNDVFDGTNSIITVACWVKLDNITSTHRIFVNHAYKSDSDTRALIFGVNDSRPRITAYYDDNGGYHHWIANTGAIASGAWKLIVAEIDVSGTPAGSIYVNNSSISLNYAEGGTPPSVLSDTTEGANFSTGKIYTGSDTANIGMMGYISQIVVWDKILSATERGWLYNSGNGIQYADI